MSSEWAPWATKKTYSGFSGVPITGSARKITLHTTETTGLPGYGGGGSAPHLTVNPKTLEKWQHIAFNRSAYALKSPGAPTSPNINAGINIQIEIIGYAANTPDYSDDWYKALAADVNWLCDDWGIPKSFPWPFAGSEGYGLDGAVRKSWSEYSGASGLVGHSHATYNDHWDPGNLDQGRLLHFMGIAAPPVTTPPPTSGPVPAFPFPPGHWMGVSNPDARNHSGYYAYDQPGIAQYQARMVERGWSLGVDGLFGPQSQTVTKQYQQEKGLAADGLAGEATWRSIWTAPIT